MAKLDIYMKSGNVIRVNNVKEWKFRSAGNEVVELSIIRGKPIIGKSRGLLISTLALDQIEGVVEI